MKNIKAYIAVLFLLFVTNVSAFESELLEGEGPWNFTAKVSPLKFYKKPSKEAPSFVSSIIKKGQEIKYDQTRLFTIKPGLVKAVKPGEMTGRSFGSISYLSRESYYSDIPSRSIAYKKGDTFEYLHYRAEGECIIRKGKEIIEIEACPWMDTQSGLKEIKKPIIEEWIRAVKADDSPIGWLPISQKTLESH